MTRASRNAARARRVYPRVALRTFSPSARREALRAAGAAVGLFILVNLAGEVIRPPFNTLRAWVNLPGGAAVRAAIAAVVANALLVNLALPRPPSLARYAGVLLFGVVVILAVGDTAAFYVALTLGSIHTPSILPASLFLAIFFAALAIDLSLIHI